MLAKYLAKELLEKVDFKDCDKVMTSLKIVARGKGNSSAFDISSVATYSELLKIIDEKLNLNIGKDGLNKIRILIGFPPRPLLLGLDDSIENHISNQESLKVEVIQEEGSTTTSSSSSSLSSSSSAKTKNTKATKKTSNITVPKKQAKKVSKPLPGVSNIHGLSSSSTSISKAAPKKRRKMINIGGSQSEVGANLVTAMSSGSGSGNTNKFWRRTMSNLSLIHI